MDQPSRCPRCGTLAEVPELEGLCPTCLARRLLDPSADHETLAGAPSLPGYEILELLGRGGMGAVYLAWQRNPERLVALKVVKPEAAQSAEILQRFRVEAEIAAQLEHPNIVRIYEVGTHHEQPYFSMEYIPGESLAERLRRERLPGTPLPGAELTRSVEALAKVARAVHYAHQRGVLHRDLKPANILLGSPPSADDPRPEDDSKEPLAVYVADFGLAKWLTASNSLASSGVLGTPSYMAPEQAEGKGPITTAADVYSLGAILYEILTGRPPFVGDTPLAIVSLVRQEQPVPPRHVTPGVNRDLEAVCLKCLQKEPDWRYPSAEELAQDLERFLRGEPVKPRAAGRLERGWRWCRRNRLAASLLAVAAASVLGGLVVVGFYLHEREQTAAQRIELAEERQRQAQMAEQTARDAAHLQRVVFARIAASRGDWVTALLLYDQAIHDAYPDQRTLRVERLRGRFALNQRTQLEAELNELLQDPDLGPLRAVVLLLRGDLLMSEWKRYAEARPLIEQALAAGGLSEADRVYSEGLLADSTPAAVKLFRQVLQIEPTHHRAHTTLVMGLLFLGEFQEARLQRVYMSQLFPRDPVPDVADAMIDLLEQRPWPRIEEKLPLLRDKLGTAAADRLLGVFQAMHAAQARLAQRGSAPAAPFFKAVELRWPSDGIHNLGSVGMMVPVFPGFVQTWTEILTVVEEINAGKFLPALDRLARMRKKHPDGFLLWVTGEIHVRRGQSLPEEEQFRRGAEAVAAWAEAANAPTLVPWIRGRALIGASWLDAVLLRQQPNGDPKRPERVFQNLLRVIGEKTLRPEDRTIILPTLVQHGDAECARLLLHDWRAANPDDLRPVRLQARLELREGNFPLAQRLADRVLKQQPDDAEMKQVRQEATEKLGKLSAEQLLTKPAPASPPP